MDREINEVALKIKAVGHPHSISQMGAATVSEGALPDQQPTTRSKTTGFSIP